MAYNLHNWFKTAILPKKVRHHEVTTIRRIFYKVPGNLVGNGRYRHIKFAPNKSLEKVILYIRKKWTFYSRINFILLENFYATPVM